MVCFVLFVLFVFFFGVGGGGSRTGSFKRQRTVLVSFFGATRFLFFLPSFCYRTSGDLRDRVARPRARRAETRSPQRSFCGVLIVTGCSFFSLLRSRRFLTCSRLVRFGLMGCINFLQDARVYWILQSLLSDLMGSAIF